jgi:hypothetical protein
VGAGWLLADQYDRVADVLGPVGKIALVALVARSCSPSRRASADGIIDDATARRACRTAFPSATDGRRAQADGGRILVTRPAAARDRPAAQRGSDRRRRALEQRRITGAPATVKVS